jgi:DNA-binding NarL/FixJ family response regulator
MNANMLATGLANGQRSHERKRSLALAGDLAPRRFPATVLIAEARSMAADTMVRSVKRAHGLVLSGRCASPAEVAAACASTPPDVAVLDMSLYEGDAYKAVTCLHEQAALAKVLLLTAELDTEHLARALMAGAENCISDCVDQRAFVVAVRATADGTSVVAPTLERSVARLIIELQVADNRRLSVREIDVMRLASKGLSVSDIAAQLFISANTTRTHLQRSYRKLGAVNRTGAVAAAMRRGMLR